MALVNKKKKLVDIACNQIGGKLKGTLLGFQDLEELIVVTMEANSSGEMGVRVTDIAAIMKKASSLKLE